MAGPLEAWVEGAMRASMAQLGRSLRPRTVELARAALRAACRSTWCAPAPSQVEALERP